MHTRLAVHHKEQHGCFLHGHASLGEYVLAQKVWIFGIHAAGVDHGHGAPTPFAFAVDAVTSHSRHIGHNRVASAGQSIKKRGFAHIGAA